AAEGARGVSGECLRLSSRPRGRNRAVPSQEPRPPRFRTAPLLRRGHLWWAERCAGVDTRIHQCSAARRRNPRIRDLRHPTGISHRGQFRPAYHPRGSRPDPRLGEGGRWLARCMTVSRCRGRVVDADGVPVARARITIVAASVPMPEIALLTGSEGDFELALPQGRFRLRAHGPGGEVGEAEVGVEDGVAVAYLVIGLDHGTLDGRTVL